MIGAQVSTVERPIELSRVLKLESSQPQYSSYWVHALLCSDNKDNSSVYVSHDPGGDGQQTEIRSLWWLTAFHCFTLDSLIPSRLHWHVSHWDVILILMRFLCARVQMWPLRWVEWVLFFYCWSNISSPSRWLDVLNTTHQSLCLEDGERLGSLREMPACAGSIVLCNLWHGSPPAFPSSPEDHEIFLQSLLSHGKQPPAVHLQTSYIHNNDEYVHLHAFKLSLCVFSRTQTQDLYKLYMLLYMSGKAVEVCSSCFRIFFIEMFV